MSRPMGEDPDSEGESRQRAVVAFLAVMTASMLLPCSGYAQEVPVYLRDRGPGMPMSQFGTYVRSGELLVYPFYEYYWDHNQEYEPADFGIVGDIRELRGRYRASEGLIFFGYGISDRLALEFEAGVITAQLDKSPLDLTPLPSRLEESGLNDVEGQIRFRWNRESARTPEFFNYFETVFPTGEKNSLIGTSVWELKLGTGMIKGFRWGTITVRGGIDWTSSDKRLGIGEYAVEYLKRVSDRLRLFVMMEGADDELTLVPEIQVHFSRKVFLKANSGFGLTSKAGDLSPEVGIMFALP